MSSFITGGPCATLHAFWISPLRQNWNCSEVRMLKKIQSSKHIQQMKLSQSLNYSITMSCSFASKRVDIWNWVSVFFSARTGGKWFLHKECADLPMCSALGLVDDRFSVNVSFIFFWYVFTWIFLWRWIQMLKIQSIIKFTSVSHLSKTSNILNCPLYLGMTGCMTVQGHCTAEVVPTHGKVPLCATPANLLLDRE